MKKILIFGNGQIGNFYKRYFDSIDWDSKISDADITKIDEIEKSISEYKPDVSINTAAMTNLEWCEQNKLETFNVNVLGADNIARICDREGIYFIHYSSGCIFSSKDENDIKKEDDIPSPVSYYAWTKAWSESLIKYNKSENFKYLILRPRQPISSQVSYKNMLVKFLTFTRFIDVPNTGTVIEDMMEWTKILIEKEYVGTLNASNDGWTTPYKIGLLLKEYVLPELPVMKISKEELNKLTPVRRIDTILDNSKLKEVVGEENVKPYEERLVDIIRGLAENFKKGDKNMIKEELDKTLEQSKARTIVNEVWEKLVKE